MSKSSLHFPAISNQWFNRNKNGPRKRAKNRKGISKFALIAVFGTLVVVGVGIGWILFQSRFDGDTPNPEQEYMQTEIANQKSQIEQIKKEIEELQSIERELNKQIIDTELELNKAIQNKEAMREELGSSSARDASPHPQKYGISKFSRDLFFISTSRVNWQVISTVSFLRQDLGVENGLEETSDGRPNTENRQKSFLESELENLRTEVNALRNTKSALDSAIGEKESKLQMLQGKLEAEAEQVADLRRMLDEIGDVKLADIVFVNSNQFCVGLKESGSGFEVVSNATGKSAEHSIAKVIKWSKPAITTETNLTIKLSDLKIGQSLPEELKLDVDNLWKNHVIFPTTRGSKTEYVNFLNLENNEYTLGYYLENDDQALRFFRADGEEVSINRQLVVPGTAHVSTADNLLNVESEISIVDYCALEVARYLSGVVEQGEAKPKLSKSVPPRVVVHLDLDLPVSHKDVVNSLFGAYYSERYKSMESLKIQLQDRLRDRLINLGVNVLEREEKEAIFAEQELSAEFGNDEILGKMQFATHIFICEIGEASNGKGFRISTRLVDNQTSRHVFSKEYERPRVALRESKKYNLSSGQLTLVNANPNFEGWRPARENSIAKGTAIENQLVVFEPSLYEESGHFTVRDPFAVQTHRLSANRFKDKRDVNVAGDVPAPCLLQYLSWRVQQETLPLAGLLTEIEYDGKTAFVSIANAKDRVKRGDRMFIFRSRPEPNKTFDSDIISRLPVDATVLEVFESGCRISTQASSVRTLWTESSELVKGDIVCPPNQSEDVRLQVKQFTLVNPSRSVLKDLNLSSAKRIDDFSTETRHLIDSFCVDLHSNMSNVGLSVMPLNPNKLKSAPSHRVTGQITPRTKYEFIVSVQLANAEGEQLFSEKFNLEKKFIQKMQKRQEKKR